MKEGHTCIYVYILIFDPLHAAHHDAYIGRKSQCACSPTTVATVKCPSDLIIERIHTVVLLIDASHFLQLQSALKLKKFIK